MVFDRQVGRFPMFPMGVNIVRTFLAGKRLSLGFISSFPADPRGPGLRSLLMLDVS